MQLSPVTEHPFLEVQALDFPEGAVLSLVRLDFLDEYVGAPDPQGPANPFLTEQERQKFAAFRLLKRRREWLGGRLAAKHAALTMMAQAPDAWQKVQISNDPQGKPFLEALGHPARACPHISISHSHGLAVAMAAAHPCGIDVQRLVPTILNIRERFADQGELEVLASAPGPQGLSETARLTLLWAAKEAVRKMIPLEPLLWFNELRVVGVASIPTGNVLLTLDATSGRHLHGQGHGIQVEVWAHVEEEYVFALGCFHQNKDRGLL